MDSFAVHRLGNYIGGRFLVESCSDGFIAARNPSDRRQIIGQFPWHRSHVDGAVAAARVAQREWAGVPRRERIGILHTMLDRLASRISTLSRAISAESGRPIWEAELEVRAGIRAAELVLREGPAMLSTRQHPTVGGAVRQRPLGVVAVISPAPQPFFVSLSHIFPALLSGNSVVWKPSSETPATAQLVMSSWDGCRLTRGAINMVQGPGSEVGQLLTRHSGVDAVLLGGRARSARQAARQVDGAGRRLFCLRGGKAQSVVFADAPLQHAAYEVAVSAYLTTGQRVNSTGRVFVQRSVLEPFLSLLVGFCENLNIGPPWAEDVFCGPLIRERDLRAHLRQAKRFKAEDSVEWLSGGERVRGLPPGGYVRPGVFLDRSSDALVSIEEAAGPILSVVPFDEPEEAFQRHEESPFALASAVFTKDEQLVERARCALAVGNLNWNRGTIVASFRLPVSGQRASGKGLCGNLELLRFLTHPQATLTAPDFSEGREPLPGVAWPMAGSTASIPCSEASGA